MPFPWWGPVVLIVCPLLAAVIVSAIAEAILRIRRG